MNITSNTAALAAIDFSMELNVHAQELGRDLPATKPQYIQAFYQFLTADNPQEYEVRLSGLRTKITSVKAEMSAEFRTKINSTHIDLINTTEKMVYGIKGTLPKNIPSKHARFDLPNIGITDALLEPQSLVEHAQLIANKIERMAQAVINNDWNALIQIDQQPVQKSQNVQMMKNHFAESVEQRRDKKDSRPPSKNNGQSI